MRLKVFLRYYVQGKAMASKMVEVSTTSVQLLRKTAAESDLIVCLRSERRGRGRMTLHREWCRRTAGAMQKDRSSFAGGPQVTCRSFCLCAAVLLQVCLSTFLFSILAEFKSKQRHLARQGLKANSMQKI